MKNGKAPGEDRVTSETLKMEGKSLEEALLVLLNKCLKEHWIPTAWRNIEVIIADRLTNKFDFYQLAEQVGFRKGYSTKPLNHTYANRKDDGAQHSSPLSLRVLPKSVRLCRDMTNTGQ